MKRECLNCKKDFESKSNRKIYCSNACKVFNHRKNKGIEEPNFLKSKYEPKPKIEYEEIEKTREVNKKFINDLWKNKNDRLEKSKDNYANMTKEKERLMSKFVSLANSDVVLDKTIGGAGWGAIIGTAIGNNAGSALWGMFAGGLIGNDYGKRNKSELIQKDRNKAQEIQKEILVIDRLINSKLIEINQLKLDIQPIQKYIERTVTETYVERIEKIAIEKLVPIEPLPEPLLATKKDKKDSDTISLIQLQEKKFETVSIPEYEHLIGSPPVGFSMLIYAQSGIGKSTWSMKFANYLASTNGKTLYNSSEEGFGLTLQKKTKDLDAKYLSFSQFRSFEGLKEKLIKDKSYRFVFIDSINDMAIKPEQLKELRDLDKKRAIIYIMQTTKEGNFKGDNAFKHDADYILTLDYERNVIVEKNR